MEYSFEKLKVYQQAMAFVRSVYSVVASFPIEERFALSDQLRRAAVSVPSNLAEGLSKTSGKEKIRYVEIAYGSLMECYCQLHIAHDQHYITDNTLEENKKQIRELSFLVNALSKSIQRSGKV